MNATIPAFAAVARDFDAQSDFRIVLSETSPCYSTVKIKASPCLRAVLALCRAREGPLTRDPQEAKNESRTTVVKLAR